MNSVCLPVRPPVCAITLVNMLGLPCNFYTVLKMKHVIFTIHLQGHTKEFLYVMVFGDRLVATYFKLIALFQT